MENNFSFREDNIIYLINTEEKTASVIGIENQVDEIIIPSSAGGFIITSISSGAFRSSSIKSIRFSKESRIKKIEKYSFSLSSIESLEIPQSLIELEEGWCHQTNYLNQILIDSTNPRYQIYDEGIIIGKETIESIIYENIVFCSRDKQNVTIPNFIKTIDSYSFEECRSLKHVKFQDNSELQIIKEAAFNCSKLMTFTVPLHLKRICDDAFGFCDSLFVFNIPKNSELEFIGKQILYSTPIRKLSIPASLIELKNGWCSGTSFLNSISVDLNNPKFKMFGNEMIIGKSSIENDVFDVLVFCIREIETIQIPDFIKIIGPFAFSGSTLKYFKVPDQITTIGESAFLSCDNIKNFEISENSHLKTIENNAFEWSKIKSLHIPSNLVDLKENWCYAAFINEISVSQNNPRYKMYDENIVIGKSSIESLNYDVLVFCARNAKNVTIPSFIKKIDAQSFYYCCNLASIEFQPNSQLEKIGKNAFSCSSIQKIKFPQNLTEIDENAFSSCSNLQCVGFDENSHLQKINVHAFSWTSIVSFTYSSHIKLIDNNAFYNTRNLKIIEVSENSTNLGSLYSFSGCKNALVMIPAKLTCH